MAKFKKLSRSNSEADESISLEVTKAMSEIFPVRGNFFELSISGINIVKGKTGRIGVKDAVVSGATVANKVKATVTLKNLSTSKVVDSKTRVIMSIPAFTSKGSFVVEGNSYAIPFQQRLRPGAYTLRKNNGAIETMFNLEGGRNFAIKLKKGNFVVKVGPAHVSLYTILNALGTSDAALKKAWGEELFNVNQQSHKSSDVEKFLKLFAYGNNNSSENPTEELREVVTNSSVSKEVVKETLGIESAKLNPQMLIAGSIKLLGVFNGEEQPDDRENMMFKQIVTPERMLAEALEKGKREILSKIKFKLSNPNTQTVDEVLGGGGVMLGRPLKTFVVSSASSIMPEEYNPVMMAMANHLITPLGEGGVGDTRALNLDTKAVHASHLGFIDPIVSPEGASVGITLAVTSNAYVDEDGSPAMKVTNAKTGKDEVVPLSKLWKSNLAYPVSKERLSQDGIMVRKGTVDVLAKRRGDVDYVMRKSADMHSLSTNLVPLLNSADANRGNMAQKHVQQSLSLTHRERPNVSVSSGKADMAEEVAKRSNHIPTTKYGGEVVSIRNGVVSVRNKKGEIEKIETIQDMPLARKTFVDHKITVKVGDKLKPGDHVADSNFTKDGGMALGINIRTAWLSQKGNRNDGVVISETAAELFTSEHMYKENITIDPSDVVDFQKFKQLFPKEVSKWGESNYDRNGIVKKGIKLRNHQPMAFVLKKADAKQIMSKMEKVMFSPYKAKVVTWHHADEGEVVEVVFKGSEIRLNVKVKSKAKVGDKLSGRYGNKGVITRIVPDEHQPKDKDGNVIDVTMTSAGVISRTNGGSLIEAGLSKIVEKTGKRYEIEHYEKKDNLAFMEAEAKKHGVELYEEIINPETGKPFPRKIFVGNPLMMKLFKDGESSMSAVGIGATDANDQPVKGGKQSASSYSNMETNALLAYGAKSLLAEAKHIKSQKNDAFFDAFRQGIPTPPPVENFAGAKFNAYLEQMGVGIRSDKQTKEYSMYMMTDKEVVKNSAGKIRNADTIHAKNGRPVKGGLFDENIFGGAKGNRTSHIDLGTKVLNPLYKDHVARLLGLSEAKLLEEIDANGIEPIIKKISAVNPEEKITALKKEILSSKNEQVANRNIKSIKMLEKTIDEKVKVQDVSFISKIPVISPLFRPVTKDGNGDISINDMNLHYQDIFALSEAIKKSKGLKGDTLNELKSDLYKSVGAMQGLEESPNRKMRDKNIKGVLDILGGDTPKQSYAQQKLLRVKQFMSGRGVIVPSRKDISLDQIEIPEDMGLEMYEPHISRRMARAGFSPNEVKDMIEEKDERVISVMKEIGKEVPVAYNRAPTLWRHGILGGYPVFTKGSVIGTNPLTESALGSDYDGDQIGIHVPVTKAAIADIKEKMMPSQTLFNDRLSHENPSLLALPDQDATLGIYKSSMPHSGRAKSVKNIAELKEKIRTGEIHYSDKVKVG